MNAMASPDPHSAPYFEAEFGANPNEIRAARQFVEEVLKSHDATRDAVADIKVIVSELATNVVEHGTGHLFRVGVDVSDPDCWEVEVVGGHALPETLNDPARWSLNPTNELTGRGLGIVRQLADRIILGSDNDVLWVQIQRRR